MSRGRALFTATALTMVALLGAVVLQQYASTAPARSGPPPSFEQLAADVEAEIARAETGGYLWLHTRAHLRAARAQHAAGDEQAARTRVAQARAELALARNQDALERARYDLQRLKETAQIQAGSQLARLESLINAYRGHDALAAMKNFKQHENFGKQLAK